RHHPGRPYRRTAAHRLGLRDRGQRAGHVGLRHPRSAHRRDRGLRLRPCPLGPGSGREARSAAPRRPRRARGLGRGHGRGARDLAMTIGPPSTMAPSRSMSNDAAANWRSVCLITLGAFLGLSVAAFATGLLPGDLAVRHDLLEQETPLAYRFARVANQAGTWHVLLPATLLLYLLSRAARRQAHGGKAPARTPPPAWPRPSLDQSAPPDPARGAGGGARAPRMQPGPGAAPGEAPGGRELLPALRVRAPGRRPLRPGRLAGA